VCVDVGAFRSKGETTTNEEKHMVLSLVVRVPTFLVGRGGLVYGNGKEGGVEPGAVRTEGLGGNEVRQPDWRKGGELVT